MQMRAVFTTILLALLVGHASAEPISRSVALLVEGLDEPDAAKCGVRDGDVRSRASLVASKAQWTISEDAYDYLSISAIALHLKPANLCSVSITVAIKRSLAAPGGRLLMGDTVSASRLVVAPTGEVGRDALTAVDDLVKSVIVRAEELGL
jgi:hypothetical protein